MTFVLIVLSVIGSEAPLSTVVHPTPVHDLGKLTLAFVMLWAYISFSQWLIMRSGNLPEGRSPGTCGACTGRGASYRCSSSSCTSSCRSCSFCSAG